MELKILHQKLKLRERIYFLPSPIQIEIPVPVEYKNILRVLLLFIWKFVLIEIKQNVKIFLYEGLDPVLTSVYTVVFIWVIW